MAFPRDGYARLLDLCGSLAGLIVAAVAALVSVDVVIRNLGIGNFPWLTECAEYGIYIATFLAAPWVLRQGAHVRVDLVLTALPAPLARHLERFVDVVGLAISLVLLYYSLAATIDAYRIGSMIFKELVVAEWWLRAVIPLSTSLLAVEFGLRALGASGGEAAPGDFPKKRL